MPRMGSCAGCAKEIYLASTSAAVPMCRQCRRGLVQHGDEAMYSKRGCRCDVCRAAQSRRMREYVARRKAEGRPVTYRRRLESRECARCGAEFQARPYSESRFCSLDCANTAMYGRARAEREPGPRRRAAEKALARAAAGTTGGNRIWVQGDCLVCSEPFTSPGAASRYCSRECRSVARGSRSWIPFEARRAIYVRDEWTCQICGEATSRRYSSSDPWSPTLDHIVPRSQGGSDDPSNLRSAHLWCNSVRGDLSHYTDADLQEVTSWPARR